MINLLDSDEEDFVPDEPVNPYDQKTEIEPLVRTRPLDNYNCKLQQEKNIHLAALLKKKENRQYSDIKAQNFPEDDMDVKNMNRG